MLTDAEMYERMEKGWRMGKPETVCGNGSTLACTENIRVWLPRLVIRHEIYSVCDAGAGDQFWISHMKWPVHYSGYDLIPRNPNVRQIDITREALPKCDAILCRMVLNHLDAPRILMALELFRKSSHWLIATQFNGEDLPKRSAQFSRLDLRKTPYNLGEPVDAEHDGSEDYCSLALFRLN